MHYPDSVEFLYALGNELKSVKLGLERIQALLAELGNPQDAFRIVHVAGTNGKGSTCAMIASALEASGLRTGLYTSPHLLEPTERIRIAGADISRDRFVEVFRTVHTCAETMVAAGTLDMHPTYFETITAMGFVAFAEEGVEWAVVEVGLGGRLDATNVVKPALAVITPVDYDHEAWLGKSIESIAAEKAGILKAGVPCLFGPQRPEVLAVLGARAAELDLSPHLSSEWRIENLHSGASGASFHLERERPLQIACPLLGAFQVENARTAAAALDLLDIAPEAIEAGIHNVRWPGRLERVSGAPDIYVDGAHNPAGCTALAEFMRHAKGQSSGRLWLIFGAMRDKAVSEMAGLLFPLADELILTAPRQPRAVRPEALAQEAPIPSPTGAAEQRVHLAPTLDDAMRLVMQASPDDQVFIAGSLFLAGETKAWFATKSAEVPATP